MIDNIYDITKEYDDMFKITVYKQPYNPYKQKDKTKVKKINIDWLDDSLRRTRRTIFDYAHCNDFEWFVTFTFNPNKVNRYNPTLCYLKMQGWLERSKRNYPEFAYVIVPEKHKDGAIHFHALIKGYEGNMKKTNVLQNNKRVYNITGFTFGFTNATKLDDDRIKTTAYLCKYITKGMITVANKRRYWCSKNLVKPMSHYNKIYDLGINKFLSGKTVVFETDFNVIHEVPKQLLAEMN